MIAILNGFLVYKSIDHIIIDVGGIGYRVFIPLSTYYSLPEDGEIKIYTHTHVREDALSLYGFLTPQEKELFATLITISGVGPKLAVNILSHIPVTDLKHAIVDGDVARLSSLPGIGKKTAERLILELKDKLKSTGLDRPQEKTSSFGLKTENLLNDVISAMVNLGYKENQARKVLENMELAPDATMEDTLKGALKLLVR